MPDTSTAPRVIATVFAGGVLAAAGQAALTQTLPTASAGADVLRLSAQELLGTPATATAPLVDLAPAPVAAPVGVPAAVPAVVAAEPRPVDVAELVKAIHRRHDTARATPAPPRVAPTPRPSSGAAERAADVPARPTPRAAVSGDDVQMVAGRVTSGFGFRWGRAHRGLDVAAPVGTPIRAPLGGEVVASGPASGFGLWVRLRHDDGTVTTYGHVNRTLVRVGQHVTAGQEIAEVGNRGESTGPHLHVEVQTPAGSTVNPRPWLDGHGIGY